MKADRFLLVAALLALPAHAHAQQIVPPRDLYCAAEGSPTKLIALRFQLLEGTTIRKTRDFDIATIKPGTNIVTFTKNSVATTINGMRIDVCNIEVADMVTESPAGQRWKTRVYNLKVGDVPTLAFELLPHADGKPGGYIVIRGKGSL